MIIMPKITLETVFPNDSLKRMREEDNIDVVLATKMAARMAPEKTAEFLKKSHGISEKEMKEELELIMREAKLIRRARELTNSESRWGRLLDKEHLEKVMEEMKGKSTKERVDILDYLTTVRARMDD